MLKIIIRFFLFFLLTIKYSFAIPPKLTNSPTIQWSGGPINWPCEAVKNIYKSQNKYNTKNVIATRIAIFNDVAIVALPRYKPGIPITLAKIPLKSKTVNPTLSAFPNWEDQEEGNCEALQSVVDIFLDPKNILWALDTGIINSMDNPVRTCAPKVIGYDVKTGNLVKSVDLKSLVTPLSRLQYVISDYSPDGNNFLYITDAEAGAIIVYNVALNHGYRIILPKQTLGRITRDVLQPILIRHRNGTTDLLFSYRNSKRLYVIHSTYLQSGAVQGQIFDVGAKSKNIIFLGTDSGTGVFFRYEGKSNIYRWDATTSFCQENFNMISRGIDNYSLATQVIYHKNSRKMRVLQSNFLDYIQGNVGCGVDHSITFL